MQYVIKRQFARGPETAFAEFKEMNEAVFYSEKKIEFDASQNVKVIYRIYEMNEVVKEYDPDKMNLSSPQEQGSQGKGSTASFRPTPLNTAPRPPGSPANWMKGDEEDEEKKK